MTKVFNIIVTEARIDGIVLHIHPLSNEVRAEVRFSLMADDGSVFKTGNRVFWEVFPPEMLDVNGDPIPSPAEWKQLPANIATTLKGFFTLAKTNTEGDYGI